MLEMPIAIESDDLIVGNCVDNGIVVRCLLPEFVKDEELGMTAVAMSHKTPDYETLVHKGLHAVIAEIDRKRAELEGAGNPEQNKGKLDLLESMRIEVNAAMNMADRYADLAGKLALDEKDATRKNELLQIAEVCRRVPGYPARTMQEAVQSFWFINYAFFQTQTNISCGRLDQLFNPFFVRDIQEGVLTVEKAQELIDCLCMRVNDRVQIDPDQYTFNGGEEMEELGPLPKQFHITYISGM